MDREAYEIKSIYENSLFSRRQKVNPEVAHLREKIYEMCGALKDKRVLFVGCGDGIECIPAARQGALVYGVDLSKTLVMEAKSHLPESNFFAVDYRDIKLTNSFDVIISILSINYSENLLETFRTYKSLLKPNGSVVVATVHPIHKMVRYNDGNYFVRGKVYYNWNGVERFNYFHLIDDYINALIASGLSLATICELETPEYFREDTNKKFDAPIFLVLSGRKNAFTKSNNN